MPTVALIGLGSNLGDRRAILDQAVSALAATPGVAVHSVSSYHETAPVGGPPGQGPFLNAAVRLDTDLDPESLHARLRAIEADAGRVRRVRWGERTLDLDLLLHGERIIATAELTVPHPRMFVRRFVLAPLAEVAPEALDPHTGRTIVDLLANLDRRPQTVGLAGWPDPVRGAIVRHLPPDWTWCEWPCEPIVEPTFGAVPEALSAGRLAIVGAPARVPVLRIDTADPAAEIRAACLAASG